MDGDYVGAVLSLVDRVPPGRVTTYGALADAVGRGGPRQAGQVLARHGDEVAWWRVVHADGRPATCHEGGAVQRLLAERVSMRNDRVVDLDLALWVPA